jgi:thiol-disulfide isomerase/thioredoxin
MTRPVLIAVLLGLTLAGCATGPETASPATDVPTSTDGPASTASSGSGRAEAPDGISEPPASPPDVPEQLRFEARTIDGEVFKGESLHGTPAMLWFWAPWCPTCQAEAPTIAEASRIEGVRFVGVAAQDEVPAMREFVDRFSLGAFPHLADTNAAIWKRFDIDYQPAYAFVSSDGSVEVEKDLLEPDELMSRVRALR